MFQSWRLKIRQAEEAFRQGQLDEARRLLDDGDLREYLPGKRLAGKLATALLERAQSWDEGDAAAAWRDVEAAAKLGGDTGRVQQTRETLFRQAEGRIGRYLEAEAVAEALSLLDRLEGRLPVDGKIRALRQLARHEEKALQAECAGRFAEAEKHWQAAATFCPQWEWIEERLNQCRARAKTVRRLEEQLHRQLANGDWQQVLALADELLDCAAESKLALTARRKAWAAVDLVTSSAGAQQDKIRSAKRRGAQGVPASQPSRTESIRSRDTALESRGEGEDDATGERFMLWIDGVGGYLVCLGDRVVLGRPSTADAVDVPILANLSRKQAVIHRDAESYLLEAVKTVRLDGKEVAGTVPLADGQTIDLGSGVELRFRLPHPYSHTARLDVLSPHRTQPMADGVLLMAESSVLGPARQSHIVCDHWPGEVMLFRQGSRLFCRGEAQLEVDGREVQGAARIDYGSRICGEQGAINLEAIA